MERFKVTCLKCKESDVLTVGPNHAVVHQERMMLSNFLSFRFRGDSEWGFMCKCGNDNRLAASEEKDFNKLVSGDPLSLKRIVESLKIPDNKQFAMESV